MRVGESYEIKIIMRDRFGNPTILWDKPVIVVIDES